MFGYHDKLLKIISFDKYYANNLSETAMYLNEHQIPKSNQVIFIKIIHNGFPYISQNKILLLYIFKIKNMVSSPNKYFIQFLKSRHECFEE